MSHTPTGGHPQGWEHKLAERSSLPPASGEERSKYPSKHGSSRADGSSGSSGRGSPGCVGWAVSLHRLLRDAEGVRLFRKYVEGAGGLHLDRLNFYFAVHGLRQETDPAKIRQVVSAIYKFLRKSQLAMPEDLKGLVKQHLKDGTNIEKTIFDQMEQEVSRSITETTYQSFLRSEAYVSYVSAATQPLSSGEHSPGSPAAAAALAPLAPLATLHEGQELARLTPAALRATQQRRLHPHLAPSRRSAYSAARSAHVTYAAYCPASRQDSDRASLSSGRADSDAAEEAWGRRRRRAEREVVIPRTQRPAAEPPRVLPPAEFAPLLIERLERLRRETDAAERLQRRLAACSDHAGLVAAALRDKLRLDPDDDQRILDQHVERVWADSPPPRRRAPPRRAPSADSGLSDPPPGPPPAAARRPPARRPAADLTDSGVSLASAERAPRRRRPADHTVVVLSFLDEPVPYRFKVPAQPLTLHAFKDYLPKKGNYRYFFKTQCEDLDNTVIQEEVVQDADELPTFDGKVMARVKLVE